MLLNYCKEQCSFVPFPPWFMWLPPSSGHSNLSHSEGHLDHKTCDSFIEYFLAGGGGAMPHGPENGVFCLLNYFQFSITCKGWQTWSFSIYV